MVWSIHVRFSPDSIPIISCANTEGWSLTVQGRGFKSCSLVVWKVFGVWRTNSSNIHVLIHVWSIFVFQSGHALMSWRDKVHWDGGWTLRGSPDWGSSILCVVGMKGSEGWQMKYVRRGRWRVLDRDEFLNITIIVFYELFVFVLELNQVRQSPRDRVFHILVWEP